MLEGMLTYIWPKDDPAIRNRVKLAVGLLVGAKLLNVSVPFLFKFAIDDLNTKVAASGGEAFLNFSSAPDAVLSTAVSILIGYDGCSCVVLYLLVGTEAPLIVIPISEKDIEKI